MASEETRTSVIDPSIKLTGRQFEVALGFARGLSERQMMEHFGISESAVRHYSKLLRKRLEIESVRQVGPALRKLRLATAEEILG